MLRALEDLLKATRFDSIQIENVHLLPFVPAIRAAAPDAVLVADWHNIESELMRRYSVQTRNPARKLVAFRTAQLLFKEEARFLRQCDAHTVPSDRERRMLIGVHPTASVHIIPNGVAVESYIANEPAATSGKRLQFTGSMDYHANVDAVAWFVREVWPAILVRHPDAEFTIVGRDPPKSIQGLADTRVHITGSVPDVRPYYRNADIAVVPLRIGSGTRLKILEAMAASVPVISTTLGAEGISAETGKHILRADTIFQFVEAVDQLLTSPPLRAHVSTEARRLVERSYDWRPIGRDLFELHSRLASERGNADEHDAHA
jgi:glycosyltransferase involved in cell wall biosynthesis